MNYDNYINSKSTSNNNNKNKNEKDSSDNNKDSISSSNKAVMKAEILHELKKLNAKNFNMRESSSSVSVRQFSLSVSLVAVEDN